LLALSLGVAGCESTQEESARLERAAKHVTLAQRGLSIERQSRLVKVVSAVVVHDAEGAAAIVTLRNDSANALRDVPLAISVKSASGQTLFENDSAGLEAALTSVGSLPAHGTVTWVDDQVPADGGPASAGAKVGEAPSFTGEPPRMSIAGLHAIQDATDGAGAAGTLTNRSRVAQRNVVVFVVGRRAGRIVAAGRAVLSSLAAGASAPFQAFLVGDPRGAQLQAYAPASTFR
jgi:hypothetical protein